MPEPGSERAPPALSPSAAAVMRMVDTTQKTPQDVWNVLDALPRGIGTWEDIMEIVAELRRKRSWQSVIMVRQALFHPSISLH
jgi:hypothetical protein